MLKHISSFHLWYVTGLEDARCPELRILSLPVHWTGRAAYTLGLIFGANRLGLASAIGIFAASVILFALASVVVR